MKILALLLLLCVFATIAAIGMLVVRTTRFLARKYKSVKLLMNGVILTDDGIKYLAILAGSRKKNFREIESCELMSFLQAVALSTASNSPRLPPNFFGKFVVIKLKVPDPYEYLFFTPGNAANFVKQVNEGIYNS